jgi:hypothetical protein
VLCASAGAGASINPPASNTLVQRKFALIRSRSVLESPLYPRSARGSCPPFAALSSTGWMNGGGTSPDQGPSGRRPAPARCRPRPRSRPCFRR